MSMLIENLKEVATFGGIDASNDRILLSVFEDHEAYKNAINPTAKPPALLERLTAVQH